jgi:fatty-acyl-CoA synthase
MSDTVQNESAGWRMKVAVFSLCVSIFAVLWLMVAALGTKFGLWPWQVGLGQMTMQYGIPLAAFALGFAFIAQIIALIKFPRKHAFMVALASTLIAGFMCGRVAIGFIGQAASLPPIHDIQTDWSDPVQFSEALLAERAKTPGVNAVDDDKVIPEGANARWPGMGGKLVSEAQEEAELKERGKSTVLPKMEPIYFNTQPSDLADLATTLFKKRGWELVTPAPANPNNGDAFTLEATATSGWFGFKDDIAIRIRPVEGAVRVDMRSISRVGLSDLGANSKRVSGFMYEMQDKGNGRVAP